MACCLASNSSIYLLDEPFINLDADSQEIIMEAMDSKIHNGAAVIFTSHDQNIKNSIELNLNDYKLWILLKLFFPGKYWFTLKSPRTLLAQ